MRIFVRKNILITYFLFLIYSVLYIAANFTFMKNCILLFFLALTFTLRGADKNVQFNSVGAGNPFLPGYFADPTIKKFGDTYYLYSTTDGNGGGKGPSQVWVSKDFVNWTMLPMNWPTSLYYWAPDVLKHKDNKYYLFYCEPSCEIYCGVSDTPRGPWMNVFSRNSNKSLIPDRLVKGAITLDGQTFVDDDGSIYIYFGTWGIYEGFGCGVAKLSPDLKTIVEKRLIPNTEVKDFFEAPYVNKINGVYYFTYSSGSCHDDTYRVQYATSTVGPMGPFVYAANNPILATSADRTIHGPGHHSILKEGNDYYIVYHRHNIPNSTRGMHRQVAVDKLVFSADGRIERVDAGHCGVGQLQPLTNNFPNLALGKPVTASSYYDESYKPDYAVDDNNATLWRPKTCGREWIKIDLGKEESIQRIWTQFEYPTSFYQYLLETSLDGKTWKNFSDRQTNLLNGSPMVDYIEAKARYVRLTFTGSEKNGISGALWNIKVFGGSKIDPPQKLIDLSAITLQNQVLANDFGMLGGRFLKLKGNILSREVEGQKAFVLEPHTLLESSFKMPSCLSGNKEYTLSYKQFGTLKNILKEGVGWMDSQMQFLSKCPVSGGDDTPRWHQIAICSDGKQMLLYIDNRQLVRQPVRNESKERFQIGSGKVEKILADVRVYNWCQHIAEIAFDATLQRENKPSVAAPRVGVLVDINASNYVMGDAIGQLRNERGMSGHFTTQTTPLPVVLKNQRLAFEFDGSQWLHSDFGLPETVEGNSPYSISAWVMNPDLSDIECILDINQAGGELEKIVFGYGKDDKAGIIAHHAGYEDMGLKSLKGSNGWKHVVATYDGFKERIYLDGKMVKEKDIVLRLPLSKKAFIGKNFAGDNPFTGWLSSLTVYDTPLTPSEINQLYAKEASCNVLLDFQAANCSYLMNCWSNEGVWKGNTGSIASGSISDMDGKIVLSKAITLLSVCPEVKQKVRSLVCEFLATGKETKIISWDHFSLTYHASKKQVIVQNGDKTHRISDKNFQKKGWMQIVLLPERNEIYVNGHQLKIEGLGTLTVPVSTATIGSDQSSVSRIAVYTNELSEQKIEDGYIGLTTKGEKAIPVAQMRASSSDAVRLLIENPQSEMQYYYLNETTGSASGWTKSAYYLDESVSIGKSFRYLVKAKDRLGNVYTCLSAQLNLNADCFEQEENKFSSLVGSDAGRFDVKANDDQLLIGSANSSFKFDRSEKEPFLYQTVAGNFVMQIEIADFTGLINRKPVGLNEGGLMIAPAEGTGEKYWLMHLSAFPYWSAGNLLTYLTERGRPQYANKKGWDLDRFMQIERCGNYFFFRTSADGKNWTEMPNSPFSIPQLHGKPVKVGPYQASNSPDYATFTFKNFKQWKEKSK